MRTDLIIPGRMGLVSGRGMTASLAGVLVPPGPPNGFYTTNFPLTENPISEGGIWLNGLTDGLDWSDVQTTPGKAFNTEDPATPGTPDGTAILKGTWGPDQTVTGTAFRGVSSANETEFRVRSTLSAHSCTGYEINFSGGYTQIVRWNGAFGDFTVLADNHSFSLQDGDKCKVTIIGTTITVYVDSGSGYAQVNTATDATFSSGNPGIGMFDGGGTVKTDIGWTTFTASDH